MEKNIKIFNPAGRKVYNTSVREKQTAELFIQSLVKTYKIKSHSPIDATGGYKLVDLKTMKKINKKSEIFNEVENDGEYLLLKDENDITVTRCILTAIAVAILVTLVFLIFLLCKLQLRVSVIVIVLAAIFAFSEAAAGLLRIKLVKDNEKLISKFNQRNGAAQTEPAPVSLPTNPEHAPVQNTPKPVSSKPKAFCFENDEEYQMYLSVNKDANVTRMSSQLYLEEYQKAYNAFEKGDYEESIKICQGCFKYNPVALRARFEMCQSYIKLNRPDEAISVLKSTFNYLYGNGNIAKFYRFYGFAQTELKNFEAAAACYIYSYAFEKDPKIENELLFIRSKLPEINLRRNPAPTLQKYGIPVKELPKNQ